MNSIQVKCYLFANTAVSVSSKQQSEIRILNLTFNCWNGIFSTLVQKIRLAYESLLTKKDEIKTYWQDDENELICFSSDDELRYAINIYKTNNQKFSKNNKQETTSNSNNFLKIYIARKSVTLADAASNQIDTQIKNKISEVRCKKTCSECNSCIINGGFKCNICPNYFVCEACQIKGFHKVHTLTKEKLWPEPPVAPVVPANNKQTETSSINLAPALSLAKSSVPVVKNDEQLKHAGEILKKIFDPLNINVGLLNEESAKTPKSVLKVTPKQLNRINTDPETLKKIGEDIRTCLDLRGIDTVYTINNSICCNSCNEQINGQRYKCTKCFDYDLCEKCEKKGIHKEHLMIKVAKKNAQNKDLLYKGNLKYCFSCNDPIIGTKYKCNTCINHFLCEPCEKKGVQKPHSFRKVSQNENDLCKPAKLINQVAVDSLPACGVNGMNNNKQVALVPAKEIVALQNQEKKVNNIELKVPALQKGDKFNTISSTPGVRFKFSSRLSYNVTENKENKNQVINRNQSRLEQSSSVEKIEVNKNSKSPFGQYYQKNIKSKSVYSSSESNLSSGTLSPAHSETFSVVKSTSTLNVKTVTPKAINKSLDFKVMKVSESKLTPGPSLARNISAQNISSRQTIIKDANESVDESEYENYSKKGDRLNISSFSMNSSTTFDSDIDIDKELQILETIDRLRLMGYEGQWVKRLVNAKNGNMNLVLDVINQQKKNTNWTQKNNPKIINKQVSKSHRV